MKRWSAFQEKVFTLHGTKFEEVSGSHLTPPHIKIQPFLLNPQRPQHQAEVSSEPQRFESSGHMSDERVKAAKEEAARQLRNATAAAKRDIVSCT